MIGGMHSLLLRNLMYHNDEHIRGSGEAEVDELNDTIVEVISATKYNPSFHPLTNASRLPKVDIPVGGCPKWARLLSPPEKLQAGTGIDWYFRCLI